MAERNLNLVLKAQNETSAALKAMQSDLKRTADATEHASKAGTGLGTSFKAGVGMALGGITALAGAAGIGKLVSAGMDMNKTLESSSIAFKVLLGSADAAQQRIKELSEFAAKTPFELPEVVEASRVLQTFGGNVLATGDNLKLVGDVASGVQRPFSEVALWFGRLYDGMKSGRPIGEATARLQEMGAISGEARDKLEKLAASGRDISETWMEATKEFGQFNGMMEEQSQSFSGLMSTFGDAVNSTMGQITKPLFDLAKGALPGLISLMEGLPERLAPVGKGFELIFAAIGPLVTGKGFDILYEKMNAILGVDLAGHIAGIIDPLANLFYTTEKGPGVFDAVTEAVTSFLTSLEPDLTGAIKNLRELWDAVWPHIQVVFTAAWDVMKVFIVGAWDAITTIIKVGLAILSGNWEGAWTMMVDWFKRTWNNFLELLPNLFKLIGGVVDGLAEFFRKIGASIVDAIMAGLRGAWDGLVSWFGDRLRDLGNMMGNLFGGANGSRQPGTGTTGGSPRLQGASAANMIAAGIPNGLTIGGANQYFAGIEAAARRDAEARAADMRYRAEHARRQQLLAGVEERREGFAGLIGSGDWQDKLLRILYKLDMDGVTAQMDGKTLSRQVSISQQGQSNILAAMGGF